MFYQDKIDPLFRFGDVVKGYISVVPHIQEPIRKDETPELAFNKGYKIDISLPCFSVILSPCCSIGGGELSLTPFIEMRSSFFDNEYLAADLTRLNVRMNPEQSVSSGLWNRLPLEERQKRLNVGKAYAFKELFVYEKNDKFPEYTINRQEGNNIHTNDYMINFKNIYKINCDKIRGAKDAPLFTKVLQLTIETRNILRDKIAQYFADIPKEDIIV